MKFKGIHPVSKTIMNVAVIDWLHDEVLFDQGTDLAYPINECNLMQSTGIKDCKGVEVYQSDTLSGKSEFFGEVEGEVLLSKYHDNEECSHFSHFGWNVNGIPLVDLIEEGLTVQSME